MNKRASGDAVTKELKQMLDLDVWTCLEIANLSKTQMKKIIRSLMFLKEERDAAGKFVKMKAHLIAGGNQQDRTQYDNLSSPSVFLESVVMIIAIAAIERKIFTIDIAGAYLECTLPDGDEVIIELDPLVTRLLQELDPDVKQYETTQSTTLVKLKKALYGRVQSSRLWYERLCIALKDLGFVANPYEQCVFNTQIDGVQVTAAFHVDDLLVTSTPESALSKLVAGLKKEFVAVSVEEGVKHSYLAMNIAISDEEITVDKSGYLEKLLEDRIVRKAKSPASANLYADYPDSPLLNDKQKEDFHSDIAKLLFIAKRVRLQCLAAVSVLASKVQTPTEADQNRRDRLSGRDQGPEDEIQARRDSIFRHLYKCEQGYSP